MANDLTIYDLTIDSALAELNKDQIVSSNPDLENAVRSVVDNAASQGVENLGLVFVDAEPKAPTELDDLARQLLDVHGGTIIVRSPGQVAVASEHYSRAAIQEGELRMMEVAKDYPLGLNKLLDELQAYSVPWTLYSLIVGALIIAVFAIAVAFWWNKGELATTK